ncbi:MAG TPA: LysR family transcriptional regulator [Bacteroidia bacterium]|nr:LysR family transcriptional regulator [Bacteroidia bacterium]HNT79937.1 LysR family transcriptional regulator [Bacteroidia bacterium]
MNAKGNIWLENKKGMLIGPGRMYLLELIEQTGSIKSAAAALKMSYRQAWAMVSDMNKNAAKPIIQKTKGGVQGGGTALTPEGKQLIKTYKKVLTKMDSFVLKINATLK